MNEKPKICIVGVQAAIIGQNYLTNSLLCKLVIVHVDL